MQIQTIEDAIRKQRIPKATATYTPVPNGLIIDEVRSFAETSGLQVIRETFGIARKGNQSTFTWCFRKEGEDEIGIALGIRNSYDKSLSFELAWGASVIVCTNGMFRVEGVESYLKRLHTGEAIPVIKEAIWNGNHEREMEFLKAQAEAMKFQKLSTKEMAQLAGELYITEKVVNGPQLAALRKEILKPTYNYGGNNDTLWDFNNHVTAVLKDGHPGSALKAHHKLHGFLESEFGLVKESYADELVRL